ncbi:MAG TPA: L-rhamnose mutarotase [Phycisphaerae bacterium]|nr:L-rhamnose mutarotase [Phycisphaerae bacterium]HOI53615.1 L-rhamnose mutarotase [Phycisphaerae bacterium]
MQRIGRVMRIREGKLEEYRRLHAAVWPEVLAALARAGIRNYTIYHHGGLLFSTMEYIGDDYVADRERLLADPAMQRWNALTGPCLEPLDGPAGAAWPSMDELFHMD